MTSRPRSPTSGCSREGDACPRCGGALRFQTAIEVGHIFKLGTTYSVAARRDVPRRAVGRAADRHGELRHRPRPRPRCDRRAATRRSRHRLARVDRAVRRPPARARRRLSRGRGARDGRGGGAVRRPATTSSSTIARRAPARSSPTPTSSACRSGSRWGRRASTTAPSTSAVARTTRTRASTVRL